MTFALAAAVGAAVVYGVGSVLQAVGVRQASSRGRGVVGAAIQPAYLGGLVCDLGAWAMSLVALRQLPVFVVQAVLAGSLAVTVVLAALTIGTTLRRGDLVAIAVTVLALVVLGVSGGAERAAAPSTALEVGLVTWAVVAGVAAAVACRWATASVVAGVGGLAYGCGALAVRVVPAADHVAGYLGEPLAWAVVGSALVGTYAYAFALDHGDVGAVTATLWVAELVVPGLVGVIVLGDQVRRGWMAPAIVASLVAIGCIVVLARAAAAAETAIELGTDRPARCTGR